MWAKNQSEPFQINTLGLLCWMVLRKHPNSRISRTETIILRRFNLHPTCFQSCEELHSKKLEIKISFSKRKIPRQLDVRNEVSISRIETYCSPKQLKTKSQYFLKWKVLSTIILYQGMKNYFDGWWWMILFSIAKDDKITFCPSFTLIGNSEKSTVTLTEAWSVLAAATSAEIVSQPLHSCSSVIIFLKNTYVQQ